jgi:myosin XV
MGTVTDTCGLDYILDLIGEKELCPAFPALKNDMLRTNGRKMSQQPPLRSPRTPTSPGDIEPLKRPLIPPPAPPQQTKIKNESHEREKIHVDYSRNEPPRDRKKSIDLLSRSSALNERYFEIEKSRSRSLDDLMNSDSEPAPAPEVMEVKQPLNDLGLSGSRLNDRYHSAERLIPVKQPLTNSRHMKPPYVGKRAPSTHSGKYMDRSEMLIRSSGMSDTSETPSLASHVRRVRVPSQASDVDQFLDDLFSPVLDGNLDELSDARSLAASIRGSDYLTYAEAPLLDEDVSMLMNANLLCRTIKGGGDEDDDQIVMHESTMEEYITDLFQPIFMNENIRNLAEKEELADVIRGGGGSGTNGDGTTYQSHTQRAFLESAMEQNIKIQQQLIAQNEALQTLLCQQAEGKAATQTTTENMRQQKTVFKYSSESGFKEGRARIDMIDSNGGYGSPPPPVAISRFNYILTNRFKR